MTIAFAFMAAKALGGERLNLPRPASSRNNCACFVAQQSLVIEDVSLSTSLGMDTSQSEVRCRVIPLSGNMGVNNRVLTVGFQQLHFQRLAYGVTVPVYLSILSNIGV